MADEQRVSQGGVTVGSTLVNATERVSQAGVTIGATLIDKIKISQVGITVPSTSERALSVSQAGVTVISYVIPDPPTNLAATGISSTSIGLTWTNNVMDRTALRIERSLDDITYVEATTIGPDETSHLDTPLLPGTIYYYKIAAVINTVIGPFSASVSAETKVDATGDIHVIMTTLRRRHGR